MRKINVESKSNELVSILSNQFRGKINLARIRFIAMFVCALCKAQTVGFDKLACSFDSAALAESNIRKIQRFMANYILCPDLIARFIFSLLPEKNNLMLSIDRTNWKFGKLDINIFMLGVNYNGLSFPLLFTMLEKRGNSNAQERIDLISRFISLFGEECIDCILADREFVGDKWIEFLNENKIKYYIRIRSNFKIFIPNKNKEVKAFWLFNSYKVGEFINYPKIIKLGTQLCYISGCRTGIKNGKREYLIIISFNKPEKAQFNYKQRWQIETCFKAMKSSGFDIEKTHLNDIDRIGKLTLLIMTAFVWCYRVGIYLDQNVKKIKIKKHGRKAKSLFKYGLSHINEVLSNSMNQDYIGIMKLMSCT
jgi:hypothetical protein